MTQRILLALVLSLLMCAAQAVPIVYSVEGTFSLETGTDLHDLDGRDFVWQIAADTDYIWASTSTGLTEYNQYEWSNITIDGLGLKSVTAVGDPTHFKPKMLQTRADQIYGYDGLFITDDWQIENWSDVRLGTVLIEFGAAFFPDSNPHSLPGPFNNSDVANLGDKVFYGKTFDAADYLVTFSSASGVIPIPAAFWLFGSALGLLGWMRRKGKRLT